MENVDFRHFYLYNLLRYFLGGIFFIATPVFGQLQPKLISGLVVDENGKGLSGVTVAIKGSLVNTLTESNGRFKIMAASKEHMVFSHNGRETITMLVGNKSILNVVLKSQISNIEEVVVIGYGTQKKKDLTGSISRIDMDDFNKAPVRSFDEALAGRVAGVHVTSSDGRPGAGTNIVIRGNNSVTQANSPLYVIDGFLIEDPNNNVVNPKDIESIDILKDASATAIYGARGANGVIVITTKRGKEGNAVFTFSNSVGVQSNINKLKLMNPYEFVKYQLEFNPALTSTPSSPTEIYLSGGKTLEYYKTQKGIDWQDLTSQIALFQNNDFSLRGGTKKLKYAFSLSSIDQDGILLNSNYKRYQGRAVIDYKITDRWKVGINANYSNLQQSGINPALSTGSATANIMVSIWGYRPITNDLSLLDLLQDPDVNSSNDYRVNPLINLQNLYRLNTTKNTIINGYLEYFVTKDLKFRTTLGITENRARQDQFNNSKTQYGFPGSTNGVNGKIMNYNYSTWLSENTINWDKKISESSKLNILGGFTIQKYDSWSYGRSVIQLPNEDLRFEGFDQGVEQIVEPLSSVWTMSSFIGRINYNYNSKYLFTISFRADGSSKFSSQNHWGYFPSVAASWKFDKEKLFKNSKILTEGKFRVSYGITGNNRIGDFDYLSAYSSPISSGYVFNNEYIRGTIPTNIGNSNLKWESTRQIDSGIDLGFFRQKILFTADLYRKLTKDLLLNSPLPPSSGFENVIKNIGTVENKGLELTLTSKNIKTDSFSWTTSANISFNRNKLVALNENQRFLESTVNWDNQWSTTPGYIAKIGQPLGLMYGYESLGTYKYDDFDFNKTTGVYTLKAHIPTNGNTRANIQPGDIKYKDQNGDLIVDSNDYVVIGRGLPIHTGGVNNNFTYKGFDLNIFFQWSYGNDILNANRILFEGNTKNQGYLNQFASYENRWSPQNPNSDIFRTRGYFGGGYSSHYIEDGSYLRLKTISLGYSFDSYILSSMKLKSLRLYLSAQNLITWTKYSGSDPEVNSYNSALTPGFDFSTYPRSRTIIFGTDISF